MSVLLAGFGTVVLVGYVQSAHDEAAAAEPMESVLVVTKTIPKGTRADELEGMVTVRQLPADVRVDGAVSDARALRGKVAAAELHPGEQVLSARFETPQELGREGVPDGLLEVTVRLTPERALGGVIRAGDTVAVISSFEPFEIDAAGQPEAADAPKKTANTTHVILHKVLVTAVQTTDEVEPVGDAEDEDDDGRPDPAPEGEFLVTLALDATAVQQVVFTAEYGSLWLSAEPSDSPDVESRIETRGTVYA
jgi:pilus assembly protein CpaB